ncbi:MAG: hypothetical protein WCY32_01395 [Burkholderiaceae bacterium]
MAIRKPDLHASSARRRAALPHGAPDRAAFDHGALGDSLGYLIHLAELANLQLFAHAFAGTRVTPARYTALELIGSNPGIRPADLASAMAIERSNLVALIRFLTQCGWTRVEAGPNRREKALHLSDTGLRTLGEMRRRLACHDQALTGELSVAERQQLTRLLARIASI